MLATARMKGRQGVIVIVILVLVRILVISVRLPRILVVQIRLLGSSIVPEVLVGRIVVAVGLVRRQVVPIALLGQLILIIVPVVLGVRGLIAARQPTAKAQGEPEKHFDAAVLAQKHGRPPLQRARLKLAHANLHLAV